MSTAWQPNGIPFCWQPKEAFRRIEQEAELDEAASAKLVYIALSRVASDEETPTFTKPINYLATLASVNRRTVERRLPLLERLGLVTVERSKLRASHRYTLATLSRNVATRRDPVAVALIEEQKKYSSTAPRNSSTEVSESWLRELATETPYQPLDLTGELAKARRWCLENQRQCTRRFFVNWLNRCRPAKPGTRDTERLRSKVSDLRAAQAREMDPQAGARIEAELATLTAQIGG
jgi:DNA-binding transcriptional regulator YhcF (GntR family)